MKKLFALLLSLSLLLSAVVFAEEVKELNKDVLEGQTTVSLTIDPEDNEFVVVIPATVTIDPATKWGEAQIVLKAGWKFASFNYMTISLSAAQNGIADKIYDNKGTVTESGNQAFTLKNADGATAKYGIVTTEKTAANVLYGGTSLLRNLMQVGRSNDNTQDTVKDLFFYVYTLPTDPGEYTDVLTFTVNLK